MLLVHGDEDPMVPVAASAEAGEALTAAGVADLHAHVSRDGRHGVAGGTAQGRARLHPPRLSMA